MGWFNRLLGREEKALPNRIRTGGKVVKDQPLSQQLQRIGGSVTPQEVSAIFREADAGYIVRLVDLANDARQKDCTLHAVLGTRELAIQSLPFQTIPFKESTRKKPKRKDQKVADFVQESLLSIAGDDADPTVELADFRGLVGHLTGANYYGHATAETMLAKSGRYLVPTGFSLISQRRFQFSQKNGRLEWFDQIGMSGGVDLLATYPGKFVQYRPRIMGDVGCREGLVRPLMWAALFRNWDIRDWLQLAELAWKPWRLGIYEKGATHEDINILIDTLEQMTASGVAVLPKTDEVRIEWPKNAVSSGGGTHSELANFMAAEMAKAVLGQTLTTEAGNKGARSLGEVHDRVRGDIRDADAISIASVIRRHLITPLVRMNFGNDVAIPGFEFLTQDAVDLKAFSEAVLNLRKAGARIPSAWLYDTAGIPPPDADDEVLGPTRTEQQLAAEDGKAPDPPQNSDEEPVDGEEPDDAEDTPAEDNADETD